MLTASSLFPSRRDDRANGRKSDDSLVDSIGFTARERDDRPVAGAQPHAVLDRRAPLHIG